MRWISLIVALMCVGCAAPLTVIEEEDRQISRQLDRENYEMCYSSYIRSGARFLHMDHSHSADQRGVRVWMYKSDLAHNNCRAVLGGMWAQ